MDVEITELEKIDATRVDGVGMPANGIPILLMKAVADPELEKDWADWDAAHGSGGGKGAAGAKPSKTGDSKASAADAVARAKQTIADHKAGKTVSAADLKNAHDVHEAHLAHLAEEKKEGKTPAPAAKPKATAAKPAAAKPAAGKPAAAKPAAKKELAKAGARDCPECGEGHDADHKGNKCSACGADLPAAGDAAKSADEATWELVRAIIAKGIGADGQVDETSDIAGGTDVLERIADLIISEAQELKAGQAGEIADLFQLCNAAEMIWSWRTGETAIATGTFMPATMLMQSAADDTGEQIAKEGTDVDTVDQTGDLTEVVKAAIAKATEPLEKLRKELEATLAKVKATPVPGGPVLSRNVQVKTPGVVANEDQAAKAAYYREQADLWSGQDRDTADGYRKLAREADAKAVAPTS